MHETASCSARNMCLGMAGSSDDDVAAASLCCSLGFSRLPVSLSRACFRHFAALANRWAMQELKAPSLSRGLRHR